MFEKENTVFTDSKDRQVKHYYPIKKAVTLRIGSGLKEFLRVQRNQQSFFKYMEFVLTRNNFCNWCWSSSYWNFFNRKAGFNTSFVSLKQFRQFHFLKPLDILLWGFWNTWKWYVCQKGYIEGRERLSRQNVYRGRNNFWQRRWTA